MDAQTDKQTQYCTVTIGLLGTPHAWLVKILWSQGNVVSKVLEVIQELEVLHTKFLPFFMFRLCYKDSAVVLPTLLHIDSDMQFTSKYT